MSVLAEVGTALITGASAGIGEAFAHRLADRGKDLVLVARSEAKLRALAEELSTKQGVQTHVIVTDLAQPSAAGPVFDETERLGLDVDLLVNNAGFCKVGDFAEIPLEVQAFRLGGDVAVVGLPGEVFVDLGLAIKRASPFATTLVVELCNDAPGYIPTRKAFREGSYETVNSRVQPGGGELLVDAASRLLKSLGAKGE